MPDDYYMLDLIDISKCLKKYFMFVDKFIVRNKYNDVDELVRIAAVYSTGIVTLHIDQAVHTLEALKRKLNRAPVDDLSAELAKPYTPTSRKLH